MTHILDLIVQKRSQFVPEDWRQYFALQLARRMNALEDVQAFVALMERHSAEDVAAIYRRVSSLPVKEARKVFTSAFRSDH